MKVKKLLTLALCTTAISTSAFSGMGSIAYASENPFPPCTIQSEAREKALRYKYIMYAELGVYPDDSGADYNLYISAIETVTKITGTLTLYKKNSSGSYQKVDSTSIEEYSCEIDITDSLSTTGSGSYKLTFSGRVYTDAGSEPITISHTNSY